MNVFVTLEGFNFGIQGVSFMRQVMYILQVNDPPVRVSLNGKLSCGDEAAFPLSARDAFAESGLRRGPLSVHVRGPNPSCLSSCGSPPSFQRVQHNLHRAPHIFE